MANRIALSLSTFSPTAYISVMHQVSMFFLFLILIANAFLVCQPLSHGSLKLPTQTFDIFVGIGGDCQACACKTEFSGG